ncbi:ribonuclease III domain-containing protein [Thomasclavelia sp.]|uniref:Mini-ribonuclease 3 n=1 Tax=Thomasclavelia sp. TaxID=3025757 RepID=UPI0025D41F60|nr:ribonuclease III domain-containing protein [Thomasclavelia sp.]
MRTDLINPTVLAFLGDSVWEVVVRSKLIKESDLVKVGDLQIETVKYVSASSHASFMHTILKEDFFSDEEVDIYKRGRNTKGRKNESLDHIHSTGFEAIIGSLYLQENYERIKEIFERYKSYINSKQK